MRPTGLKQLLLVLALACSSSVALAQYVWLNEKGVKQYSDMPPPASVPNSRILKSPGAMPAPAESVEAGENTANETAAPAKTAPTLAEKNADFEKRRAEQAEKDKLAADKAAREAAKRKNCEQISNYQRALQSGQRITKLSPTGERIYIDDAQRAATIRDNQRALADCR